MGLETLLSFSLQAGNEVVSVHVLRGDRVSEDALMKRPVTQSAFCIAAYLRFLLLSELWESLAS